MDDLVRKHYERERERIAQNAKQALGTLSAQLAAKGMYYGGPHATQAFKIHSDACTEKAHALVTAYKTVAQDTGAAPTIELLAEAQKELQLAVRADTDRIRQRMLELCKKINAGPALTQEAERWVTEFHGKTMTQAGRELEIWAETHARKNKNAQSQEVTKDSSPKDHLTQLLNREAFDKALAEALVDAGKSGVPAGLVMGDVDHFKKVNDTHGHPAGDAVLTGVAARLKAAVHGKGQAFRYGGEELALILANHSPEEAIALAERCRKAIEIEPVATIAVTMSFGVACFPAHASDAAGLLKAADKALYEAKNYGRNLVRLNGEPAPTAAKPREPVRKLAVAGGLTEEQRKELKQKLLRRQYIECPNDGAYFDINDITALGDQVRRFLIHCPGCGLAAEL